MHLGRKFGAAAGNAAARDGPLFEPVGAVFANVGVGQAVDAVVEGGLERNELVAALAEDVEKFTEVVSFKIVAVQENDLARLVAEEVTGEFFVVVENGVGMLEKSGDDLLLERGVAGFPGGVVNGGECPVPGIERDRSDAITARGEKGFEVETRLKVAADVEIGMTEVAHFLAVLREKNFRDGFAADDGLFEFLEADLVEGRVREGVIAKFEAGVEPLIKSSDAGVYFAGAEVELALVDETDGGDLLLLERGDDVRGHVRDFLRGHEVGGAGGEIVDGDGDLALGRSLGEGDGRDEECEDVKFCDSLHG